MCETIFALCIFYGRVFRCDNLPQLFWVYARRHPNVCKQDKLVELWARYLAPATIPVSSLLTKAATGPPATPTYGQYSIDGTNEVYMLTSFRY
jgi:hypothetical protein